MVLAKENLVQIYEGLEYNFLYNNDINSMHILLNLYDLEDNMINICPKYMSTREIRKKIKRFLIYRKSRQLITNSIILLIHEDIDRLELVLYLDGYKHGYFNNKWVNIIEDAMLKHYTIDEIYEKKFLFHHSIEFGEIEILKKAFKTEIETREKETKTLEKNVHTYCENLIKNKIYNLDFYVDKQLAIEYNTKETSIKEEDPYLSIGELNKIYDIIKKTIVKNIIVSYVNAAWFGVNDRILNRYS